MVLATSTQGLRETELRPPLDVLRGASADWDEAGGGARGSVFASLVAQVFEVRSQGSQASMHHQQLLWPRSSLA